MTPKTITVTYADGRRETYTKADLLRLIAAKKAAA